MILLFSAFADNFIYTGLEVSMMIGERLQEIRKDNGDTQQDLANKLHASCMPCAAGSRAKAIPAMTRWRPFAGCMMCPPIICWGSATRIPAARSAGKAG